MKLPDSDLTKGGRWTGKRGEPVARRQVMDAVEVPGRRPSREDEGASRPVQGIRERDETAR